MSDDIYPQNEYMKDSVKYVHEIANEADEDQLSKYSHALRVAAQTIDNARHKINRFNKSKTEKENGK